MSENIYAATDDTFDAEVLKSNLPVLVDFWAEWCGPCRLMGPVIDEVAPAYSGKIKFVKVNVDECPNTPGTYNVRGIPMLILFKNGKIVNSKVGALTKFQLEEFLKSV